MDYISNLPNCIIESILTRLPIRDAIRSSILSRKWRYRWASMTNLVFNDEYMKSCHYSTSPELRLVDFVTRALFLHRGPIHKFHLSTRYLHCLPEFDQWILFLSRSNLKELVLQLGVKELYRVPSSLFSFHKLTHLELHRCEFEPPISFNGFPLLKTLNLHQVLVIPEALDNLISSCPVLEILSLSYFDHLSLKITAPNLKYLNLEGELKDLLLENTPRLISMSVAVYMNDEIADHAEQTPSSNFSNFLGSVPNLERLVGQIYFTKYLSIGDHNPKHPITYNRLKVIELHQVSFDDVNEIRVVLKLITSSPNLVEFHVSGSSTASGGMECTDIGFWEEEGFKDCKLGFLRVVTVMDFCGIPHEMEFVRYLLANSPVLEKMAIFPSAYTFNDKLDMLIQLVKLRRVSSLAEISFVNSCSKV